MCGRTKLTPLDKSVLEQLKVKDGGFIGGMAKDIDWAKMGVISLKQEVPLITSDREIRVMRWGMPMDWTSRTDVLFWARKETLFTQQMFAAHAQRRRAIMLIDGWWERGRYISVGQPVAVAMIWTPVKDFGLCSVMVTQEATGNIAHVHDRMPAIVDPDRWLDHKQMSEWIGDARIEAEAA